MNINILYLPTSFLRYNERVLLHSHIACIVFIEKIDGKYVAQTFRNALTLFSDLLFIFPWQQMEEQQRSRDEVEDEDPERKGIRGLREEGEVGGGREG